MAEQIEIDGYKAHVTFDPEIRMYRGEFISLPKGGGADFYAEDLEQLIEEGRKSLEVYYDALDRHAYDEAKRRLESGEDEMIPAEYADRLLDGENPVRVWREFRGLNVEELGRRASVAVEDLTRIENGERYANKRTMKRLAAALNVEPGDLE